MARIPQPDLIVDDLDGKPHESVSPYLIIDPADGEVYELDLSPQSFDKLVKALAPFLASTTKRKMKDEQPAPAPRKAAKVNARLPKGDDKAIAIIDGSEYPYSRADFKLWASNSGITLGKGRRKPEDVALYLRAKGWLPPIAEPSAEERQNGKTVQ